jgi:hypothetical protein
MKQDVTFSLFYMSSHIVTPLIVRYLYSEGAGFETRPIP